MILESGAWEAPDCERELNNQIQIENSEAYRAVLDIRQRQRGSYISLPPQDDEQAVALEAMQAEAQELAGFAGEVYSLDQPEIVAAFGFYKFRTSRPAEKFGQPLQREEGIGLSLKIGMVMPLTPLDIQFKDRIINEDHSMSSAYSSVDLALWLMMHTGTYIHTTNHPSWREAVVGQPYRQHSEEGSITLVSRRAAMRIIQKVSELSTAPPEDLNSKPVTQLVVGATRIREALTAIAEQPTEPPLERSALPLAADHLKFLSAL